MKLYLEKLIDFFKWTTTIAIAALLWIGTNYNHTFFLNISLISFGLSIVSSFVFISVILGWTNYELKLNIDHLESLKRTSSDRGELEHPREVGRSSRYKIVRWFYNEYRKIRCLSINPPSQYNVIDELIKKYQKLSCSLERGKLLIFLHGLFLLGGILFFILSIVWP